MSRTKDMDRKVRRSSHTAEDGSSTNGAGAGEAYSRQGVVTKMARMKFLSHGVGGKRSPATGSSSSSGKDNPCTDRGSLSDAEPENETQIERKRRLNRNNERKKRAKRILKIEELTATFHTLANENEALKAESKELKEKIALVKQYMEESDSKQASVGLQQPQRPTQSPETSNWLSSTPAARLTVTSIGLPGAQAASGTVVRLPSLESATGPAAAASAPASHRSATGISDLSLSLISREQRIQLLQREFEKQDMILKLLRLQLGTAEEPNPTAVPSATPPQPQVPTLALLQQHLQQQQQQRPSAVPPTAVAAPATALFATAAPTPTASAPPPAAVTVTTQALLAAAPIPTPSNNTESASQLQQTLSLALALETIQRQHRGGT